MDSQKLFTIWARTAMGDFRLFASDLGLRGLYWPGSELSAGVNLLAISKAPSATSRWLKSTAAQLAEYFLGFEVCFGAPLDLRPLSPFARKVLGALARVPYGQTTTYGELARRVGVAKGARAVGSCLARNPLGLIIPCHRVLSSTGGLGGFSAPGGVTLKKRLLSLENIEL